MTDGNIGTVVPAAPAHGSRGRDGCLGGDDPAPPSLALLYDVLLGGPRVRSADHDVASDALRIVPGLDDYLAGTKHFLQRAVRMAVGAGIGQVLDLGAGMPGAWGLHWAARCADRDVRVVAVESDTAAHDAWAWQATQDNRMAAVRQDPTDIAAILLDPAVVQLLDRDRPVIVVMSTLLQFVGNADEAAGLLAACRDAFAAGSRLVMSHLTCEGERGGQVMARLATLFQDRLGVTLTPRSQCELARLVGRRHLLEGRAVPIARWPPHRDARPWTRRSLAVHGLVARI